jgi:carbon-monoxide dehydrogenase medium subunit
LIAARAPLVAEALPHVAHPQIRNRGTIGGSLAHADPAAELPAVMVALEARFAARSSRGERWIAAADFFRGYFSTALEPDELLAEVELPALPPRSGSAFVEQSRRRGDFARVGVAAVVALAGADRIARARIALLSVGPGPVLAEGAAALLVGEVPSPDLIDTAARAVDQEIDPGPDMHASVLYRRHLARILTGRALTAACGRAAS